jgi:hypothetical protein
MFMVFHGHGRIVMPPEPLQRVQEDLATVKAALGTELPYDRSHVVMYLIGAGLGVILAATVLLGLEAQVRLIVGAYIGLMLLAWAVQVRHLRARRDAAPARWRWGRKETAASLVAIVLLIGYVAWVATLARWRGQWGTREAFALASAICFFLGVGGCAWVAADRRRWHLLGAAAALLIGGPLMPLCATREHFYLLLGAMCLAGGLASGLLLWWQLRRGEVHYAD